MNRIQKSMEPIRASDELKAATLSYLAEQREQKKAAFPRRSIPRYAFAAACTCLVLGVGAGGFSAYRQPVSYISIDVNPSIELGVNRWDTVVSVKAYNEDGVSILDGIDLKNKTYTTAIDTLLMDEAYEEILAKQDAALVFTVISDSEEKMLEAIAASDIYNAYGGQSYTSDESCMQEAHAHEMSFGKYEAYLELTQYDAEVTVEDCHGMSMSDIQSRIASCRHSGSSGDAGESPETGGHGHGSGHHGGH